MAQWLPQNSGTTQELSSVYFTDANIGFVVGNGGTILKTTDGGLNWIPQYSGSTTDWFRSVYFPNANTGYTVGIDIYGNNGIIRKTTNGGIDWTNQNSGTNQVLESVYFTDANTGYAVGNINVGGGTGGYTACIILKTINGGTNWTEKYSDTSFRFYSVFFVNADTGYVVGSADTVSEGYIIKTTDGGTNWTTQNIGGYESLYSVFFTNADTGYVAGGNLYTTNKIYKTTNGGILWTNQDSLMSIGLLASVHFPAQDTGYAVGTGGTILKTTNGGTFWINQTSGVTNWLHSVHFTDPNNGYAVGQNGIILKTTNGGGFVGVDNYYNTTNALDIYPCPTSTNITIETHIKGFLSITNIGGQQFFHQEITEPKTQIDISSLPNGVYFVRLTGDRTVQVGKFMKL